MIQQRYFGHQFHVDIDIMRGKADVGITAQGLAGIRLQFDERNISRTGEKGPVVETATLYMEPHQALQIALSLVQQSAAACPAKEVAHVGQQMLAAAIPKLRAEGGDSAVDAALGEPEKPKEEGVEE